MKPLLLFSCLLHLAVLSLPLQAANYRVTWDPHADPKVTEFRVYKITGALRQLLSTSPESAATITADPGDIIAVTAFNGAESALSNPVIIPAAAQPPQPPTGLRIVEIETSSNLKDWKPLAYIPLHTQDATAQFVRARLVSE